MVSQGYHVHELDNYYQEELVVESLYTNNRGRNESKKNRQYIGYHDKHR